MSKAVTESQWCEVADAASKAAREADPRGYGWDTPMPILAHAGPEHCQSCNQTKQVLAILSSHSDNEYGPCLYCLECLTEAIKQLAPFSVSLG